MNIDDKTRSLVAKAILNHTKMAGSKEAAILDIIMLLRQLKNSGETIDPTNRMN